MALIMVDGGRWRQGAEVCDFPALLGIMERKMDLYIDCEWNGFGGELISMALVSTDGREWYEELGCDSPIDWVAENVMPHLSKAPITRREMQLSLVKFLSGFDRINIVADWPEDIERFCQLLITGPGERINTPALTFAIIRIDAESATPHYALDDARGIALALTPPT